MKDLLSDFSQFTDSFFTPPPCIFPFHLDNQLHNRISREIRFQYSRLPMQVQKYNQGDQLSQQLQLHGGKSGGTALVLASLAGTGRVGDLLRGSFLFSSLLPPLFSLLSPLYCLFLLCPAACWGGLHQTFITSSLARLPKVPYWRPCSNRTVWRDISAIRLSSFEKHCDTLPYFQW